MAQEHNLRDCAARRSRCEQRKKIVAEDDLHRLIERDALIGDLDEVHEPAAVKEHAEPNGAEREQERPRLKPRQVLQRIDVDGRVDDRTRDADDEHKKKEKAAREFIHGSLSPSVSVSQKLFVRRKCIVAVNGLLVLAFQ